MRKDLASVSDHDALLSASLVDAALKVMSAAGKQSRLRIAGHSMSPLIRDGYGVVVEHTGEVGLGDIVICQHQGGVMVHRVVRVLHDGDQPVFVTKGDNSTGLDPLISKEAIIGKVVMIEAPHGNIDLDSRFWRTLNPIVAHCSYIQTLIYRKGRLAKKRLLGGRRNYLTSWAAKVCLLPLSVFLSIASRFRR